MWTLIARVSRRLARTSWIEKITNEQVTNLQIIQKRILSWLGCIVRHEDTPGIVHVGKILGQRGRGGPGMAFIKEAEK